MDGSIAAAMTCDLRVFQKHLLVALVEAGALSPEAAAAVCTKAADELRTISLGDGGQDMIGILARQNGDVAALIVNGGALAR